MHFVYDIFVVSILVHLTKKIDCHQAKQLAAVSISRYVDPQWKIQGTESENKNELLLNARVSNV